MIHVSLYIAHLRFHAGVKYLVYVATAAAAGSKVDDDF